MLLLTCTAAFVADQPEKAMMKTPPSLLWPGDSSSRNFHRPNGPGPDLATNSVPIHPCQRPLAFMGSIGYYKIKNGTGFSLSTPASLVSPSPT